jgi:predicted Zn-dependent protease
VQNLAQAVVAGSPAKDALIQLTLVTGKLQDAAERFFGQQGLRAGRVARETVNGLPAVIGAFEAQTRQGVLGGIAGFISHGDRSYQILAYTPAPKLAGYEDAFRGCITSFARLTDRAALARQPNRLKIVRLPRAMTLAQFNRTHPSAIPLSELALINQLSGPEALMPADFRAKRVVAP